ncbi:hypothetical protein ACVNPX_05285 [Staphylococcus aureus]
MTTTNKERSIKTVKEDFSMYGLGDTYLVTKNIPFRIAALINKYCFEDQYTTRSLLIICSFDTYHTYSSYSCRYLRLFAA